MNWSHSPDGFRTWEASRVRVAGARWRSIFLPVVCSKPPRVVLIFSSITLSPGSPVARTAVINIGGLSPWTRNIWSRRMMRSSHSTRTTRARQHRHVRGRCLRRRIGSGIVGGRGRLQYLKAVDSQQFSIRFSVTSDDDCVWS
jgi:hypothetical protein